MKHTRLFHLLPRCLILCGVLLALSACQPALPLLSAAPPAVALKLRLNAPQKADFRVLAARQPEEVVSVRFCLLVHPTGNPPLGGEDLQPFGAVFRYTLDEDPSVELGFDNLVANLEAESYSVAVAAFDQNGENISNATGDNSGLPRVTIAGEPGNFYLSTSGGDPQHPGSLHVEPDYALSGTAVLGVLLKLADG
ncbi:MAG: hypothetical protein ACO1RX_20715 [Candidatus Sericytochromatia bacterium]